MTDNQEQTQQRVLQEQAGSEGQQIKKYEEIRFHDHPAKVKTWFNERLEENRQKIYMAKGWCKRCGICVSFCPVKALDRDREGYPCLPKEETCISCGTCEIMCPDFAIVVSRLKGKKKK